MLDLIAGIFERLWVFAVLGLFVFGVGYFVNVVLPRGGETPGTSDGAWAYLRAGRPMKALALAFAVFALGMAFPIHDTLQEPAFGEPWDDRAAQWRARGAGIFFILLCVGIATAIALTAASLVFSHMRYSDKQIVFRSTFGRETAIAWEDVLRIDLSTAYPILSYTGWRRKDLCSTCAGYSGFLDYARSRGIEIVEPKIV